MKYVYIIRHAKSDWSNGELSDRERPLNARGLNDAPRMAQIFMQLAKPPEVILSSPAVRARTTCNFFCQAWQIPESHIRIEDHLYFGSPELLISLIATRIGEHESIAVFGHNPTNSNLAYMLCPDFLDEMPTCAIVAIGFEKHISAGKGKLLWYEYPKKKGGGGNSLIR